MVTLEEYNVWSKMESYEEAQNWLEENRERLPPAKDPVDVCCHTHHKSPGQPCGFGSNVEEPCNVRRRHHAVQLKKGQRTCPACIGWLAYKT